LLARIHTFAALSTLVNLLVYAVAGVASRKLSPPTVTERAYVRAPTESDHDTAERVVRLLNLPLATPVHSFNIVHDPTGRLVLDFYHANGRHKVTVFDDRLHVEISQAPFGRYLSTLHDTTAVFRSCDRRMQLWAWYNEFAMWTLCVLVITGGWLAIERRWLRGAIRRTHWITALAAVPVLGIFVVSALHLAHRSWPIPVLLLRLHRGVKLPPVATVLLVMLAVTGIVLWWRGRDRRAGAVVLAAATLVSGGLVLWMRGG
jgi:hypothetical protein